MSKIWNHLTDWEKSPIYTHFKNKRTGWEIKELIAQLEDRVVRLEAADALAKIGKPAVFALVVALGDEDGQIRYYATKTLVKIGESAIPALVNALNDENENVKQGALKVLLTIGKPAVPALVVALGDEDYTVMRTASYALRQIGKPAVFALVVALENNDYLIRRYAAEALEEISEDYPNLDMSNAVPALISVLGDKDPNVRCYVAGILGNIKDSSVTLALSTLLGDEDSSVRWKAAKALEKIGPRNYKDLLLLRSAARKARNEGKPTNRFLKVYNKWSKELGKDADEFVSAAKNLPKPKPREPDSVKRVQLKRVVG